MSAGGTLMIWPSGPSTPPDAPPWLEDRQPATCLDGCGRPYDDRNGAGCPCHEPMDEAA